MPIANFHDFYLFKCPYPLALVFRLRSIRSKSQRTHRSTKGTKQYKHSRSQSRDSKHKEHKDDGLGAAHIPIALQLDALAVSAADDTECTEIIDTPKVDPSSFLSKLPHSDRCKRKKYNESNKSINSKAEDIEEVPTTNEDFQCLSSPQMHQMKQMNHLTQVPIDENQLTPPLITSRHNGHSEKGGKEENQEMEDIEDENAPIIGGVVSEPKILGDLIETVMKCNAIRKEQEAIIPSEDPEGDEGYHTPIEQGVQTRKLTSSEKKKLKEIGPFEKMVRDVAINMTTTYTMLKSYTDRIQQMPSEWGVTEKKTMKVLCSLVI